MLTFTGALAVISQAVENEPANQKDWTKDAFINEVASHAVPLQASHGIRPSVTIAQAILESNWGKSSLSQQENNYFGIKGGSDGRKYATLEYEEKWKEIHASFRSYPSLEASVTDYADLINGGTEWNPELYRGVQEASSYQEAAQALYSAGYATDPTYPEKIIEIIELYELDRFDK
ncbi:glycoside hydrolase family 73 protein [Alkalibacterium putridalgicola]|uniref:N-acetylmuramoyl-L-alanine amidase n=1 Tax=Alkalibacterium putridalgicola TaxID=426703 RepID=A0ABQ0UUT8_9LACT|nr:glycoside hydrolase family 73 protein [Alkalibacterium putridalgicola]GEK88296.1 N-acetylmuramoyl-L-alanine amidase [Alkalibacterium putridalgicola]